MGLLPFFAVLRARFLLIFWVFLICASIAGFIGSIIPPRYQAEAILQVDATTENLVTGMQEPRQRVHEFLGQQAAIAGSRATALLAVDQLIATGDLSLASYENLWQEKTGGELSPGNDLKTWIADELLRHTSISTDALQSTLIISYSGQSPIEAARYASAFADAYMQLVTTYRKSDSARNAARFDDETENFKARLDETRANLRKFQLETGYVTIGSQQLQAAEMELGSLTSRLAEARADDAEAQSLWDLTRKTSRAGLATLPMPNALAPGRTAQARLGTLIAQMERINERYGPMHPDYIEAENEIRRLQDVIHNAVKERAAYTASRVAYLSREVSLRRQMVLDLQGKKQQFDILEQEINSARNSYELIAARGEQEGLQARVETVSVFLLAQPVPPINQSMPNFWVILAVGIVLGLGMGVSAAIFVELLEGRIRHGQSIEFATRRPVLAELKINLPQKRRLLA